jgi:hypothetical protein
VPPTQGVMWQGFSPGVPFPSRRTGAAWAGLCGLGHGMDFGVGALILMGVIMIDPPKSEKGKAPHCGKDVHAGAAVFPAAATISTFQSQACRSQR